MTYYSKMLIH